MSKGLINLYVDREDIAIAKSQGLNLSNEFRNWLAIKVRNKEIREVASDKEKNILLEVKMGEMSVILQEKDKEINKLQKDLKAEKEKEIDINNIDFRKRKGYRPMRLN